MELKDLNQQERLAVVALMEFLVESDEVGSSEEAEHVSALADAYGREAYLALVGEAESLGHTEEDFRGLAASVTSQEARELIYGKIMECAMEDGIEHRESEFLDWLKGEWNIKVRMLGSEDS